MRQIPLAYDDRARTRKFVVVDDCDYEAASRYRWYLSKHGGKFVVRANLTLVRGQRYRAHYLHRLVSQARPGEVAILIDGNPLNCTRGNIRVGRRSLVAAVRGPRRNKENFGAHKGTTWRPRVGKWQARISLNGREVSLGYFPTEAEAAQAYGEAIEQHYGSFGHRNLAVTGEPGGAGAQSA